MARTQFKRQQRVSRAGDEQLIIYFINLINLLGTCQLHEPSKECHTFLLRKRGGVYSGGGKYSAKEVIK